MKGRRLVLVAAAIAALGACKRIDNGSELHRAPVVVVTQPTHGPIVRSITLPGDLTGFYESTLFAKVTGYLKNIAVDKGDWVKQGDLLANIEVPELKERLERARADLQVQKITYDRLQQVWKSDPRLVARQDVDVAFGKFQQSKALVDELSTLLDYTRIVAPFDGVITGRFVDPGALIRSGGGQAPQDLEAGIGAGSGGATAIVSEAMIDTLRIYVYVPEGVVGLIHRGTPARITVKDFPDRSFHGTVTRFTTSLDLSTRTMQTEVDIKNPQHELYPGMYADVMLQLQRHDNAVKVRESAVGTDPEGSYIFIVREGVISRAAVTTGIRSEGFVEIKSGLVGGEQIVAAVDPGLSEGELVRAVPENPTTLHEKKAIAESR